MALSIEDLNAFTTNKILKRSVDEVFANDPLFVRAHTRNAERITGGVNIYHPIVIDELRGGAVDRSGGFDIDYVVTDTALSVQLKLYWVNISLLGFDEIQNQTPESVFSLVETKWENASKTMAKLLAQAMYSYGTGTRSKHINGFEEWLDDGNTYSTIAGITRSDVMTAGTVGGLNAYTADIDDWTNRVLNTAYVNSWWGPDMVDIIVTSPTGWSRIWEHLQPMKQFPQDGPSNDIAEAGFQGFRFNGADVTVSRYLPTGRIFGINSNYLLWLFSNVDKFQFGFTGWKTAMDSINTAGQFLVANNIIYSAPRTGFKLTTDDGIF